MQGRCWKQRNMDKYREEEKQEKGVEWKRKDNDSGRKWRWHNNEGTNNSCLSGRVCVCVWVCVCVSLHCLAETAIKEIATECSHTAYLLTPPHQLLLCCACVLDWNVSVPCCTQSVWRPSDCERLSLTLDWAAGERMFTPRVKRTEETFAFFCDKYISFFYFLPQTTLLSSWAVWPQCIREIQIFSIKLNERFGSFFLQSIRVLQKLLKWHHFFFGAVWIFGSFISMLVEFWRLLLLSQRSEEIIRVSGPHPPGDESVWRRFHGNPSRSFSDISVWTKVV